ncbi:MAG: hypothetical protein QME52_05425 [Bacteroidota bacterium]|nr:hypothetical protein [Bacteroidota bacterium]
MIESDSINTPTHFCGEDIQNIPSHAELACPPYNFGRRVSASLLAAGKYGKQTGLHGSDSDPAL